MNKIKEAVIEAFERNIAIDFSDYQNVALKNLQIDSLEFIKIVKEQTTVPIPFTRSSFISHSGSKSLVLNFFDKA